MKIVQITTDNREHHRNYELIEPYFGTAPEALLQGFSLLPDLEVHVISCTQQAMHNPTKLSENIWFHSLHIPKIGWLRTGYQGCVRAIRKKIKELQPDIVHGQGTERECALGAVFSGFPSVITIHGNMRLVASLQNAPPFSFSWLAARLESFTLPRSDGVVCITHYTQEAIRSLARKTWVLPNAVDQSFFAVTNFPQETIILCVGHVSPRKNQNAFIRALDSLTERMKFKVVFLGNTSPEDPYSAEFFDLLKTRSWCEYAGFADREAMKKRFAGARLLAMPSLEENCPMVVLEAMAVGLPLVAAKVGGVTDLIEDNVTGILCDPTDAESMRRTVTQMLENPERAKAAAETAKRQALERFHPHVIAQHHLLIYRDVLNKSA